MAYQYPLNGGRINASISGNSTSAGAGYQLVSTGTLVLAGGNNVTLNQNANSISIAGPSLSNSNGFTFGTNGSVVTASYAGGGSVNFSAGTTSGNLASVNLSNANGVSFGLNAGTITASHNALTSQSAQALSASNGSFAFQTAGFSNANGVTFGTSAGSIMTASVNTSYAASNHSHGNPTLNLTNMSGTTASASNGLTLSLSAPAISSLSQTGIISLSQNGNTISIGAPAFSIGMSTLGNTAGTTGTVSNQLILAGGNNVTLSQSTGAGGNTISISAPNQTAYQFSNGNGVSFGTNGSTVTATVATNYAASNHSHGNPTLNLTNLSGTTASASNGFTLSLSAASQSAQTQSNIQGVIASGSTNYTGNISFANSNGVTFGLSNNTITASVAAAGQTNQTLGLYASGNSTGQSSSSTMDARSLSISAQGGVSAGFSGGMMQMSAPAVSSLSQTGIVSISRNGNTISIGAPAFSAGMSTGGNTSGTTGTVSNQLIFAGGNNITLSQNTGAGGNTISIIGGAGGGGGGIALANSQTTYTSGTANLVGSGAISVNSTTGQSYIISAPAQSNLSATGAVSISNNGNTISIGAPAFSAGMSTGGNTSGTTGTVSNQLIFAGGNNITLSQNTGAGGNTISIIGGAGGGGGLALSANALISSGTASLAASGALTASVNGQTLNLSVPATSSLVGVNGITISTNGGTISISGNGNGGGGGAVARWEHPTAVFTTLPAIVNNSLSLQHVYMPFNFSGTEMKIGGSLSMGTHTSASTGSATINLKMGIYTLSGSTLSLLNSGSYSTGFGVSSNSTASYNGMRQFAVTGSFNLSAGEYWVGAILSTATNYASNPLGYTVYGNSAAPTAASNAILSPFGSAVTASPRDVFLFQGMYGTTTTALPTAIQGSQINNSAASFVQRAQFYHAIYSATY